jgi:hypothetical protein
MHTSYQQLLQLRVFRLGMLQDGNVGIGVFPESKEIFIGGCCLASVCGHRGGSAELQACNRAYRIARHDAAVIENFLEFRRGVGALVCR